ncbi:hypothetical protein KAJ27_21485 [bacterium]|nr:hypothetical protein [bacterium]
MNNLFPLNYQKKSGQTLIEYLLVLFVGGIFFVLIPWWYLQYEYSGRDDVIKMVAVIFVLPFAYLAVIEVHKKIILKFFSDREYIKYPIWTKIVSGISGIVAIFMAGVAFCFFFLISLMLVNAFFGPLPAVKFNSSVWLKLSAGRRMNMVTDLTSTKKLHGKTRKEIIKLLGNCTEKKDEFIYDVGVHSFEPAILVIRFENDKVIRVAMELN